MTTTMAGSGSARASTGMAGLAIAIAAIALGLGLAAVADDDGGGGAAATARFGDVTPALTPKDQLDPVPDDEVNVAIAPDVPAAATRSDQRIVDVAFDVVENVSTINLTSGQQYETWGYRLAEGAGDDEGVVVGTPGPMIRARVGDVLRFTITNPETNQMPHNVDFHAVTGQGGGAADTTVEPGQTATIEARLLYPGIFMYHCAYGDVPSHISHGMFGGILVDPARPLPAADRELYMVQSEYYTGDADAAGVLSTDRVALTDEHPTHVVFNGAVGALVGDLAPRMQVGERMRIYFVNAGLNLDSNFHPIGSHWDAVWPEGALLATPLRGSQTTLVPAGGGVVVDLVGQVPQTVLLVDHALTRAFDKGAVGQIVIEGDENPEIFEAGLFAPPPADEPEPEPDDTTTTTEAVSGEVVDVEIPQGAFTFQQADDPAEYDEGEDPADYTPNTVTVATGTTVRWTNQDDVVHTVTADDGSFDSGNMSNGATFEETFTEPGTYQYFCTPHPWMRGQVVVEG